MTTDPINLTDEPMCEELSNCMNNIWKTLCNGEYTKKTCLDALANLTSSLAAHMSIEPIDFIHFLNEIGAKYMAHYDEIQNNIDLRRKGLGE